MRSNPGWVALHQGPGVITLESSVQATNCSYSGNRKADKAGVVGEEQVDVSVGGGGQMQGVQRSDAVVGAQAGVDRDGFGRVWQKEN